MSKLLTLFANSNNQISFLSPMANNNPLPYTFASSTNYVRNSRTSHVSGNDTYTDVELIFVNGLVNTNTEMNANYDFNIRAGIYIPSTNSYYPAYAKSDGVSRDVFTPKEWGVAHFVVPNLVFSTPNTPFKVTNRIIPADGGAAGTYNYIYNTGAIGARVDGVLAGVSSAVDYTLGSSLAEGAKAGAVIVNGSGVITSIPITAGGANYTSGPTLQLWYGGAGVGQPGALYPGSGASGFGNRTGTSISSITVSAGGTGYSSINPPLAFLGGGGGYGAAAQAIYGPSLILGKSASSKPNVLIIGDSITSGFGSVDSNGNLDGSHGWYEQVLARNYAVQKLAVSGESAAGWDATHTQQLNFIDYVLSKNVKYTHVVLALGTNDFLTNTSGSVLSSTQTHLGNIATLFRNRGAKILLTTVPPANTTSATSNKFTTLVEQTPYNVNYQSGNAVQQHNAAVRAGTTGIASDAIMDGDALMRDASVTTAWRTNCYGGATAFCATDGIHPSIGVGIAYMAANMSVPVLT